MKDTISMKSIALYALLLSLGLSLSSRAQSPIGSIRPFDIRKYTVLDSANYRINYKTTCLLDPKKHDKVTNEMYLLVGRKISKFGHVCVLDNQQELIAAESQEAGPGIEARGMGGMEVYKYLSGTKPYSELTFRLFIYSYRYTLIYSDELHPQSWTLTDERKDVLGYSCQKATTRFRGRDYTAWVATDIPISNGPWLLGGAPGLILEAYDAQREYIFEATSVSQLPKALPIVKYKDNYKRMDRSKVRDLCRRMHADIVQTLTTSFPRAGIQIKDPTFYYNPIELE